MKKIFLVKIWIFDEKNNFWSKFPFLMKTIIYLAKFPFLTKIYIFDEYFELGPQFGFLIEKILTTNFRGIRGKISNSAWSNQPFFHQ